MISVWEKMWRLATNIAFFGMALLCLMPAQSRAQDSGYSSFLSGPLGLNTIPNARMDEGGTISAGVSTLDPYAHAFIGFQLADPLYIGVRQTAETSSLQDDANRLYPGADVKLRILKEAANRPAVALGLQSAIGHKRMAGEYLALSKRYHNFDFTAGLGWGRFGSAGHFTNPLKTLSSHFGGDRELDGEMPNDVTDWFTGDKVGLFGGVEYFTPYEGLSLKLDYGADDYTAERAALSYDEPAPWAIGLNYQPKPWVNIGVAALGTDKFMGRLSVKGNIGNWRDQTHGMKSSTPLRGYRTGLGAADEMALSAEKDNIILSNTTISDSSATARMLYQDGLSLPYQLGRSAVHMSNEAGENVEALLVTPTYMGLQGPTISMPRTGFEKAAHHQSSPEEIWHGVSFDAGKKQAFAHNNRTYEKWLNFKNFDFILDSQVSLAEEDSGTLYRTSLIFGQRQAKFFGILDAGASLRINFANNLDSVSFIRPRSLLPVRSDVDIFAQRTFALESQYTSFTHSFKPDLHLALIGGYLEDMYAGIGGELLYRPFGKRWAVGTEIWQTFKRDPLSDLNLDLNGDHVLTAHLNGWYDLPYQNLKLNAKAGRYLAEDLGVSLSLQKEFKNGAKLEGYVTLSDNADFDLFGGTTHSDHGIRLTVPLGGYKYAPRYAKAVTRVAPFGRDIGQSIKSPLPLYELSTPFSYDHITQYWDQILE